MEKVVTKIAIKDEIKKNLEFWGSQTDEAKLSAVQELREL